MKHRRIERFFLRERIGIKTALPPREVLGRLRAFADAGDTDYFGYVTEDRVLIAENSLKSTGAGHSYNSFAPVAKMTVTERDGGSVIEGVLRPPILAFLFGGALHLVSLLLILPFPLVHILLRYAFFGPAARLRETLEELLWERE